MLKRRTTRNDMKHYWRQATYLMKCISSLHVKPWDNKVFIDWRSMCDPSMRADIVLSPTVMTISPKAAVMSSFVTVIKLKFASK